MPRAETPARIEVFGFDGNEASQIRRIRALRAIGHEVRSFTLRRDNMAAPPPDWPDTPLGRAANGDLAGRALGLAAATLRAARHRARLRAADLIVARNLDMLAIACAARRLAGAAHVPVVYECLDIHGALCRDDALGRAMRLAERRLLRRVAMLVVSSPRFLRDYFEPVQRYRGAWALWENRLAAGAALPPRPRRRSPPEGPIRLGWVGTLRCAPSLDLLCGLADRMGARVEIRLHGVVHRHALPGFDAALWARRNMIHHGPYRWPGDLARVYGGCDLVWAQDLWQRGGNSDWLLPNRLYEAGWAGCPSLALRDTETGARVARDRLGWTLARATPESLAALLDRLAPREIAARGQELLDRPESDFLQSPEEIGAVIDAIRAARRVSA